MQRPHAEKGLICPLHKVDMSRVCHTCPLWIKLRGKHPQSNEEIDQWGCSLAWLPVLLIENSQMSRQTGAAVESFRNEMVEINHRAQLSLPLLNRMQNHEQTFPEQTLPARSSGSRHP